MEPRDDVLVMYTVYERPRDFPNSFVVRRWSVGRDQTDPVPDPAPLVIGPNLEAVRAALHQEVPGLCRLGREPGDDPKIVETWI